MSRRGIGREIDWEGGKGRSAHAPLYDTESTQRVTQPIHMLPSPQGTERQPQDKRREHEFKSVCGAAHNEGEQANPDHLIDE